MQVQAQSRLIELSGRGIELHLLDWGGVGPLALLSHANGFCAAVWEPMAKQLRERFHVIAFDARGHGDSSKPPPPGPYAWGEFAADLLELSERLLTEFGEAQVGLGVGHSFGGMVTLECAARAPKLFGRIALLDPVFVPPADLLATLPSRRNDLAAQARRRRQSWSSREEAAASWRGRELFQDWDVRAFAGYVEQGLRAVPGGGVELKCAPVIEAAIFETESRLDPIAAAEKLRVPALLVRAARGQFSREVYARVCASAPEMRMIEIDAGHLLPMVVPDVMAKELLAFGAQS